MGVRRVHIHVDRISVSRLGNGRSELLADGIRRQLERSLAEPRAIDSVMRAGDVTHARVEAPAGNRGSLPDRVGSSVARAIIGGAKR